MAVLLVAGLLMTIPWIGELLELPLSWIAQVAGQPVLEMARWLERVFPPHDVAGLNATELTFFYVVLAALASWRRGRMSRLFLLCGLWAGIELAGPWAGLESLPALGRSPASEIVVIDVGHGNATLIRWRDGKVWLVDAGSARGDRVAFDAIASVLWDRRVNRIDRLWVSHPDRDHYNAVPKLLERFEIRRLSIPACFLEHHDPAWQDMLSETRRRRIEIDWVEASSLSESVGEGAVRVLHPPAKGLQASDNASSLVLLVEWEGRRLVLPGDVEGEATERLIGEVGACDLFVAPHHGSEGSEPRRWMEGCHPQWMIISSSTRPGWLDPAGHSIASSDVALEPRAALTCEQGCLTFRWERGAWEVSGWLGPPE